MTDDERPEPTSERPLLPNPAIPPPVQAHLRRSLEVLRDRADDPGVRRRIDGVLAGRSSLRELARDGGFGSFMEPLVRRGLQRMDELSPEEQSRTRDDAAALGRGEVPEHLREDGPPARPTRPGPPAAPSPGTW